VIPVGHFGSERSRCKFKFAFSFIFLFGRI